MTTIAAAYDAPDRYTLAADSHSVVNGLRILQIKASRFGNFLIGGAGANVEVQAGFAHLATQHPSGYDDISGVLAEMAKHVLATTTIRPKDVTALDSSFLAVGPGGAFVLGSDLSIARAPDRWALGCGEAIGIGAMFRRPGTPEDVVRLAVEAACLLSDGCFGTPVVFVGKA